MTNSLCSHLLLNEFSIQLVCAFPLIFLQPLLIDIGQSKGTSGTFYLCLSFNTAHAVVAILLLAERLTLLVGFLDFHNLHHLGVCLSKVCGRLDFNAEVVEVFLILAVQFFNDCQFLFL